MFSKNHVASLWAILLLQAAFGLYCIPNCGICCPIEWTVQLNGLEIIDLFVVQLKGL